MNETLNRIVQSTKDESLAVQPSIDHLRIFLKRSYYEYNEDDIINLEHIKTYVESDFPKDDRTSTLIDIIEDLKQGNKNIEDKITTLEENIDKHDAHNPTSKTLEHATTVGFLRFGVETLTKKDEEDAKQQLDKLEPNLKKVIAYATNSQDPKVKKEADKTLAFVEAQIKNIPSSDDDLKGKIKNLGSLINKYNASRNHDLDKLQEETIQIAHNLASETKSNDLDSGDKPEILQNAGQLAVNALKILEAAKDKDHTVKEEVSKTLAEAKKIIIDKSDRFNITPGLENKLISLAVDLSRGSENILNKYGNDPTKEAREGLEKKVKWAPETKRGINPAPEPQAEVASYKKQITPTPAQKAPETQAKPSTDTISKLPSSQRSILSRIKNSLTRTKNKVLRQGHSGHKVNTKVNSR